MPSLEVANFVFTVGSEPTFVMGDLLNEVIWPAFDHTDSRRGYRGNVYSFYNVVNEELIEGDPSSRCIFGRMVKDMTLISQQKRDPTTGRLTEDDQRIETAPSSFFILRIKDHRLGYIPEHKGSPNILEFENTFNRLVRRRYATYIHFLYLMGKIERHGEDSPATEEIGQSGLIDDALMYGWKGLDELLGIADSRGVSLAPPDGALTKKWLRENLLVSPTFNVSPIPTRQTIQEVVAKYKEIKSLEVIVRPKNHEPDNSDLIEVLRERNRRMNGTETRVTDKAKGKGSTLSHAEVCRQIENAALGGLNEVKMRGYDESGGRMSGGKESFSTKHSVPATKGRDEREVAKDTNDAVLRLIRQGIIQVEL